MLDFWYHPLPKFALYDGGGKYPPHDVSTLLCRLRLPTKHMVPRVSDTTSVMGVGWCEYTPLFKFKMRGTNG
eukprot:768133-Hanusia_phi.AAC.6